MAGKKKPSGLIVYNLLLKEISEINKGLREDRKLGLAERREFISKKIYPEYKGLRKDQVRLWPLRELLYRKLKRVARKQGCDVFAIPKEEYIDVAYYALDDKIKNIFPKCIYLQVNANGFGQTNIFNTRDYDYYRSGLQEITRNLNDDMQQKPDRERNSSEAPTYTGVIQLKPGKPKKSVNVEDYYLEMILYIREQAVEDKESVKPPTGRKYGKRLSEKRKKERDHIKKMIAEVRFKETKIKSIVASFLKNMYFSRAAIKKRKLVPDKVAYLKGQRRAETARLNRYMREKKVTKKYYDKIKGIIERGYPITTPKR